MSFFQISANVLGLCEVAENRSGKFRFRRHVAKANFYLLIYEKANKIGFCGLRSTKLSAITEPAILQSPCYAQFLFIITFSAFVIAINFSQIFPSFVLVKFVKHKI